MQKTNSPSSDFTKPGQRSQPYTLQRSSVVTSISTAIRCSAMVNPFKHAGGEVATMFREARSSDCAPGPATVAAVIATPVVTVVTFVAAFFKKAE